MDVRRTVGVNITCERKKRNLTRKELSERTGLAESGLSEIEHGNRAATVATVDLIARTLGIPTYSLMFEHPDRDYSGDPAPVS